MGFWSVVQCPRALTVREEGGVRVPLDTLRPTSALFLLSPRSLDRLRDPLASRPFYILRSMEVFRAEDHPTDDLTFVLKTPVFPVDPWFSRRRAQCLSLFPQRPCRSWFVRRRPATVGTETVSGRVLFAGAGTVHREEVPFTGVGCGRVASVY